MTDFSLSRLDNQELYFEVRDIPMDDIPYFLEGKPYHDKVRVLTVLEEIAIQNPRLYIELWSNVLRNYDTDFTRESMVEAIFAFDENEDSVERWIAERLRDLLDASSSLS